MMTSEQSVGGGGDANEITVGGQHPPAPLRPPPPAPCQADLLAGAAASVAAAQTRQQERRRGGGGADGGAAGGGRRRLGSRLRARYSSGGGGSDHSGGGGGESWADVQIFERDSRICSLEREVEASALSIKNLRSDLVQLRASFKEDEYHAQMQVDFLQEENAAFAVKVAKLEEKIFRMEGRGGGGRGGEEGEKPFSAELLPPRWGNSEDENKTNEKQEKEEVQQQQQQQANLVECTEDLSTPGTSENNTVTLDVAYVAQLRNDVDKSKRLIELTEEVLAREVQNSTDMESRLRDEISFLKTEREERKAVFDALSTKMGAMEEERRSEVEDLTAKLECRENTVRLISKKIVDGYERSGLEEMEGAYFQELRREVRDLKFGFDEEETMMSRLLEEDNDGAEETQEERLARELH